MSAQPYPEQFNHYVPTGALRAAWEYGNPATALCGYTWFPTGHDPRKPICPTCDQRAGLAGG